MKTQYNPLAAYQGDGTRLFARLWNSLCFSTVLSFPLAFMRVATTALQTRLAKLPHSIPAYFFYRVQRE